MMITSRVPSPIYIRCAPGLVGGRSGRLCNNDSVCGACRIGSYQMLTRHRRSDDVRGEYGREDAPTKAGKYAEKKKPSHTAGLSIFWLPDLDSNQGPAD
jgi:hypothetical protein